MPPRGYTIRIAHFSFRPHSDGKCDREMEILLTIIQMQWTSIVGRLHSAWLVMIKRHIIHLFAVRAYNCGCCIIDSTEYTQSSVANGTTLRHKLIDKSNIVQSTIGGFFGGQNNKPKCTQNRNIWIFFQFFNLWTAIFPPTSSDQMPHYRIYR